MTNPIVARLAARGRFPTPRTLVLISAGLLLSIGVAGWLLRANVPPPSASPIGTVLVVVVGLIPVLIGVTAAQYTAADLAGEGYHLLRATLLSPARIVQGYMLTAAYRLRIPLALGIMLTAVLLIYFLAAPLVPFNPTQPGFFGIPGQTWAVIRAALEWSVRLQWIAFALVLGVAVGMHRPKPSSAAAIAIVLMLVLAGVLIFAETRVNTVVDTAIYYKGIRSYTYARSLAQRSISVGLGRLLPLLVLTGAAWWAAHRPLIRGGIR